MKHMADIKHKNKNDIIHLLYKKHNMSKKRIAIELALSPSVITKLCNELLAEQKIIETNPLNTNKAGRKEIQIKINPDYKKCIGIVMNHKKTTILLTDMNLNILQQTSLSTHSDPQVHMDSIINSLKKLIDHKHLQSNDILGIGISIKGATDGTFAYAGIWDYKVNVTDYLYDQLHIPVAMDNGIRCSAMLEQLYSTETNFIFIKYMEPGIGGAIVQDGQIKLGENHTILDFGHLIIDPEGEYCSVCKRRGCLESMISFEYIIEYTKTSFSSSFSPILWSLCEGNADFITIEKIIESVEKGCIQLNKLFQKIAGYFAMSLINTYALLDIKKFIIIGDLFSSKRFITYLNNSLYNYQLTPIAETIEFHVHENVLLSSVVLAINSFFLS